MRIDVTLVWYNGMGGHPAVSFAGEFLLMESVESYGASFDSIELYPHVPSRSHDPKLSTLLDRFKVHTRDLPQAWIKRKSRRIEVSYNSELGYKEEIIGESPL